MADVIPHLVAVLLSAHATARPDPGVAGDAFSRALQWTFGTGGCDVACDPNGPAPVCDARTHTCVDALSWSGEFPDAGHIGLGFSAEFGVFDGRSGGTFGPNLVLGFGHHFELSIAGQFAIARPIDSAQCDPSAGTCEPTASHLNAALLAPKLRWLYSRGASPVFYAEAGPQFGMFWNALQDGTQLRPEDYAVGAVGGVGALWRFSKILRGTLFLNTGFDRAVAEGLTLRLTIGAYVDAVFF